MKQYWKVDTEQDMNALVSMGWKLIQVVTEPVKTYKEHWFSVETIYHDNLCYLMGCPEEVLKRKDNYESVSDYLKRRLLIEDIK